MRADLYQDLYEKESDYWWHVWKRETILSLLVNTQPGTSPRAERVGIDLGCGTGYTANVLESQWRMIGTDLSPESLLLCRRRGLTRLCRVDMSCSSLPFKTESVDLVLALDVIEHIDNDVHALTEYKRILRQGGILIITVPAFMVLWSPWDEALGHKRRYTVPGLISAVNKSGLRVVKLSYFFLLILPAVVAVRQLKCFFKRESTNYTTDFITVPRWLNKVLITAGRLERWFIVKLGTALPFGLSIISVLQKPKFGSNPRCS